MVEECDRNRERDVEKNMREMIRWREERNTKDGEIDREEADWQRKSGTESRCSL